MSINIKIFIGFLALIILPLQKEKDKCLIIYRNDNEELYKIGTIANRGEYFYILLKYSNSSENKKREKLNAVSNKDLRKREELSAALSTGVQMNPTGTSYNLENKEKIEHLPDNVSLCNCATLDNFDLGMRFKLYVEKDDGWLSFDAPKFLVEE